MNKELEILIDSYDDKDIILSGLKSKRIQSGRINPLKLSIEQFEYEMNRQGVAYKFIPWFKYAFIILGDINEVRKLEIYDNGGIYIQSLSSMLPALYLEPKEKEQILDMAAAPGGKTTLIAALSNNLSQITACEQNPIRFQRLKYNIEKQGVTSCYLIQKDARTLDEFFSFDKILLDAPCSGSGTLDFNIENKQFTNQLVSKSIEIQHQLLSKAIKMLKKNQTMIYSTCSILKQENEEVIKKYLKEVDVIPIQMVNDNNAHILKSTIEGVLTIAPNEYYEGFFIAKLRKK